MPRPRRRVAPALAAVATGLLVVRGAAAQPATASSAAAPSAAAQHAVAPDSAASPAAPAPAPATALPAVVASSRDGRVVSLHGYFTQAAATSRGGLAYGIPNAGTLDLRRAALLLRFAPTVDDRFIVQAAQRRLGESPRRALQPDLKVDWLFYERSFGDATRLRLGRMPIPYGIYAETRYVGTLLPFYHAPTSVYREGEFSNESTDGLSLTHEFLRATPFPLEVTGYVGDVDVTKGFSTPTASGAWTYGLTQTKARALGGVQVWLGTPVPGLRLGAGQAQGRVRLTPEGEAAPREPVRLRYASLDADFDRVTVRAEALRATAGPLAVLGGYVNLGVRPVRRLELNLLREGTRFTSPLPAPPTFQQLAPFTVTDQNDWAASAIWTVRPGYEVRLEGHRTRGFNIEEARDLRGRAPRGGFAVVSFSAAF